MECCAVITFYVESKRIITSENICVIEFYVTTVRKFPHIVSTIFKWKEI